VTTVESVKDTTGTAAGQPLSAEPQDKKRVPARQTVFGYPRDFLDNRFVYTVVSPRAHGLSVGVNMNPDKLCNFDCLYCEVDRSTRSTETKLEVPVMAAELRRTLAQIMQGKLRERPWYQHLPDELLKLRHVTLSGDGEPTLAPNFAEVVEAVVHVRALGEFSFFKIVLLTNAVGLDQPHIQEGLKHLTKSDEIWAKLDAGTEQYLHKLARPENVTLEKVLSNILLVARQRPVVIQSLFPAINGEEPPLLEIEEYAHRLRELREAGARISLVQIYSATRPMKRPECGHLPLKMLSHIAQSVRQIAGLKAEVF
jgi:wyosine [tRNA(Phe)-imidazoG37] synthetase (radical SAM superfamily)